MARSTINSKGQITFPKEIRDYLQINEGDRIEFVILENGTVVVKPAHLDAKSIEGFLSNSHRSDVSIEEMNEVVRKKYGTRS